MANIRQMDDKFAGRQERAREVNLNMDEIRSRKYTLVLSGRGLGRLVPDKPLLGEMVGRKDKAKEEFDIPALSQNTKGWCASFSMAAGYPTYGGSCPASAIQPDPNRPPFICYGCYATSGRYAFPSTALGGVIRKIWVDKTLARRDGVRLLTEEMINLLDYWFERPRRSQAKGGRTPFSPFHFRWHDSGDVFSEKYWRVICNVAREFEHVLFWLPTRMWVFEKFMKLMASRPENLIVRPSNLYFDEPPMFRDEFKGMEKLDASTSSSFYTFEDDPRGIQDCPAARYHSDCDAEECRVCWEFPDRHVNYRSHALPAEVKRDMESSIQQNPNKKKTLEQYWKAYQRVKKNPATPFEAYLAQHGDPKFSHKEWISFMENVLNITDPYDQIAYMDTIAEWL